jgi:hypothetical protein
MGELVNTPDLGPTWADAIDSAYRYGHDEFRREKYDDTREKVADLIAECNHDEGVAWSVFCNDAKLSMTIRRNKVQQRLWDAIDAYYHEHRPDEYRQLQREAVVAEDIVVAFEAGAMDALFDRPCNTKRVEGLK